MGVVITKAAEGLKVDKGDGNPQYLSQPTVTPKGGVIPTIILTSSSGTVIATIPINTLDTIGGNPPAGAPPGSDISGIVDQLTALLNNPISATTAATASRQDTGNTSLAAINTAIGGKADAVATSDTGSFSIIAFLKRMLGNWTTLLGKLPALNSGRIPVDLGRTGEDASGLIPSLRRTPEQLYRTVLHANNISFMWDMAGYSMFSIALNNNGVSGSTTFLVQTSNNGKDWANTPLEIMGSNQAVPPSIPATFTMSNLTTNVYAGPRSGRFMRITMMSGAVNHTLQVTLSANPFVPRKIDPGAYPDALWNYASPTGGTIPTAAATLKAGFGPAFRMALVALQITNSGTAGTEFQIRDGSTGTTYLYVGYIAAGASISLRFDVPLRATAGNPIQILFSTSVNVIPYVNAQGYTANA